MASQCPSNKCIHYYSLAVCPQALLPYSHLNFSAHEQKGQGIENEMTGSVTSLYKSIPQQQSQNKA